MVARGLASSRTRAQELVTSGYVTVDGVLASKPALEASGDSLIEVTGGSTYVSRAAHKLAGALDACPELAVEGRLCLDVGASTGGFTEVLLERGAGRVHAIDVGHGQLAERIAQDPRVTAREGLNARDLSVEALGERPALVVADVSFISLTLLVEPIVAVCAESADLLLMVKPQFEVGKGRLGRNGVVTDPRARAAAVATVIDAMVSAGLAIHRIARSTLPGPQGNVEFFVWASQAWQAKGHQRPEPLDRAAIDAAIARETGTES